MIETYFIHLACVSLCYLKVVGDAKSRKKYLSCLLDYSVNVRKLPLLHTCMLKQIFENDVKILQ